MGVLVGFYHVWREIDAATVVGLREKLLYGSLFGLFWSVGSFLTVPAWSDSTARFSMFRRWAGVVLCYYLFLLSHMLFLDGLFRKTPAEEQDFWLYFRHAVNLKPFATIRLYWNSLDSGALSLKTIVINLLGNLAAFAPLGLLLPLCFRYCRNFFLNLFTIAFLVACAEVTQLLTYTGSCDIDDFILNVSGAFFVCLFMQIPPVKRFFGLRQ